MSDWIIHEPAETYHGMSKSGEFMSSHLLTDFRKSPLLYRKKILGQVEETKSASLAIGSAAHKLILEGREAFNEEYIVSDGPINERTGEPYGQKTKAYSEWLASQLGTVISPDDFGEITKFNLSVRNNENAVKLLSKGEAEGVVRADLYGIPCQIRMDWYNPEEGLVDLKTTAELQYFEYDAKRFGYVHQMAFYRAVIRKATGIVVPVHIIAVEKVEPYASGVWLLTPEVLDEAECGIKSALERFKSCRESGIWPTGYENLRIIDSL